MGRRQRRRIAGVHSDSDDARRHPSTRVPLFLFFSFPLSPDARRRGALPGRARAQPSSFAPARKTDSRCTVASAGAESTTPCKSLTCTTHSRSRSVVSRGSAAGGEGEAAVPGDIEHVERLRRLCVAAEGEVEFPFHLRDLLVGRRLVGGLDGGDTELLDAARHWVGDDTSDHIVLPLPILRVAVQEHVGERGVGGADKRVVEGEVVVAPVDEAGRRG
uniref:Uncharacterized protein n=2 Tax=Oryza sativa subsp. japonica TaxID=39947 RepID=Q53NS5_ORYSJ|nr:hypothetical protein LOC_Os11g24620 [Oryza sativa Japonica Group]ABA93132.1 hypothetical protein LOC_Os11g24620 [Oryza sativa Japonica Group]